MNTNYKPLPRIVPQNINLFLGSSVGLNIDASLAHAKELLPPKVSGSVLYINTVQSTRSMYQSARKLGLNPQSTGLCQIDHMRNIYILNVMRGDLHKWKEQIKELLDYGYIQYVIINSWEFAARNSRYREEAIFLLKDLTEGLDGVHPPMNLLVYAQETNQDPTPQKLQRGGFGKLSALAKKS